MQRKTQKTMLKGKFYTGLPEKMMHRSQCVDRQRTQFYWPDESDIEDRPIKNVKRASTIKSSAPPNNSKLTDIEIKPKELFQKQLTSGIEFYDNVNAKTPESRRRRFKKIENINLTNNDSQFVPEKKKLETFSSKIEFYDFVDDVKSHKNSNGTNKITDIKAPAKKSIDEADTKKKLPERSDSMKKRITFKPVIPNTATKGILKNSENKDNTTKESSRAPFRRGLAKKSLSKSVENLPRLTHDSDDDDDNSTAVVENKKNDLASVVRDVKNLKLNEDQPKKLSVQRSRYADFDDNNNDPRSGLKNKKTDDYSMDAKRPDEFSRRDEKSQSPQRIRNKTNDSGWRSEERAAYGEYVDRGGDRDDPYDHPKINRKYSEDLYESRTSYRSDRNKQSPVRGEYEYRYESPRYNSGSRYGGYTRSSIGREDDSIEESHYQRRTPPRHNTANDATGRDPYDHHPPRIESHYENRDRYGPNSYDRPLPNRGYNRRSPPRQYSPERRRPDLGYGAVSSQRHLKSTFSFNSGGYPPQQNRPISVRQSAVQRIGVGLPDFQWAIMD